MSAVEQGTGGAGALDGLRVLDLSFFAPGRVASLVLGDLGADVVCVEMPRGLRPAASRLDADTSSRWLFYQRNKRSITLDLKSEGGHRVFEQLVADVDVVIESYKPGTAERLGVDYESVRRLNEQVVYCSVSGFGQSGPYAQVVGHEPNYQGLAGALGQNRMQGAFPTVLPTLVGDMVGGAYSGVMAILSALWYRERSGQGQYLDVAIAAGIVPLLGSLPYAQWQGEEFRARSFASGHRADFRAYRTKDDRYVAVSPLEPWLWERFCRAIDREDLIAYKAEYDMRRETDVVDGDELIERLAEVFAGRTQAEWAALNERENIAVSPVLESIQEIEQDPQMVHRGLIQEAEYEPLGTVKQIVTPFKMSATPPRVRWIPRYGQHTDQVLEQLGYDPETINDLRTNGVIE